MAFSTMEAYEYVRIDRTGKIAAEEHGSTPQRVPLPRSDVEILTTFYDDTSSIRDDYTARVTADPTTKRARHVTDTGNATSVS